MHKSKEIFLFIPVITGLGGRFGIIAQVHF